MAAAVVIAFHVVFGFAGAARSVRTGMGSVLGFGLVFGTTALALYGATLALLATPMVRWLRSARNADPALLRAVRLVLAALAIGGVVLVDAGQSRPHADTAFVRRIADGRHAGRGYRVHPRQSGCDGARRHFRNGRPDRSNRIHPRSRNRTPAPAAAWRRLCHCDLQPLGRSSSSVRCSRWLHSAWT